MSQKNGTAAELEVRLLSPTGMLGTGFLEKSFEDALELKPHVIGCDAGSTDPGPAYLGSGRAHLTKEVVARDLRVILRGGRRLGVPVLIGSAGTAGGQPHLEALRDLVIEIAREEGLSFKLAVISAEQSRDLILQKLQQGKITPLPIAPPFDEDTVRRSSRIVGMMGAEPFQAALAAGADVVIAGRANDTAIFAALPLMKGIPEGIAWHAAKILECGTGAAVNRKRPDCMFAWLRKDHFEVRPVDPDQHCTPQSVASHSLYENADPFRLTECSGVLDLTEATYAQTDSGSVRVSGSTFEAAESYTVKLEGAEHVGYQSVFFGSVRDPIIIGQIDDWLARLTGKISERVTEVYGADAAQSGYRLVTRVYGRNGTMGPLEPVSTPAHELCLIFEITATSQDMANSIASMTRHTALHLPVPEWSGLITAVAAPYSYLQRGAVYKFNVNHVVHVDDPLELFPITFHEIAYTPPAGRPS